MSLPEISNKESIENLIARSKSEETRAKIEALNTKIEASDKEISALIDASTEKMNARSEETQKEIEKYASHEPPYFGLAEAFCPQPQTDRLLVLMGVLTTLTAAYLTVKLYTSF